MWGASSNSYDPAGSFNKFVGNGMKSIGRSIEKSAKASMSNAAEKTKMAATSVLLGMLAGAIVFLCVPFCVSIIVMVEVGEIAGLALGILAGLGTMIAIPAAIIGIGIIICKLAKIG
jgi:hypothetical protein